jgi:hypothetical protein
MRRLKLDQKNVQDFIRLNKFLFINQLRRFLGTETTLSHTSMELFSTTQLCTP